MLTLKHYFYLLESLEDQNDLAHSPLKSCI